jgi:uncharacterized protein YbbC (DUF1343 family)
MEACAEAGIPLWILDRPNPIGRVPVDGPVLSEDILLSWEERAYLSATG